MAVGPPKTVTTPNTVIREIRAGRDEDKSNKALSDDAHGFAEER